MHQTLELQTIPAIPTPRIFLHIITLINRATGDEKALRIETFSDRFVDVMREVTHQRAVHRLWGYEVYEVLDCNDPFRLQPSSTRLPSKRC